MVFSLSSFEDIQITGTVISDFHHTSLLLVTFINQLTHSIDTVVEVKISVV